MQAPDTASIRHTATRYRSMHTSRSWLAMASCIGIIQPLAADEYTFTLYDTERNRQIPVAIYSPAAGPVRGVVLFNHGYNRNKDGSYRAYTYLTRLLAQHGYYVASIQHELPGDDLLAMSGDLYRERMPNWQRGVGNVLHVHETLRRLQPGLPWHNTILIGHSNGGDTALLTAATHPGLAGTVITLDHLRHPIPRTSSPRIHTLRASDTKADPGVIPTEEELRRHRIGIIQLENMRHGDMDDKGTPEQHAQINSAVLGILHQTNHEPIESQTSAAPPNAGSNPPPQNRANPKLDPTRN